jgi:hypothetical protein
MCSIPLNRNQTKGKLDLSNSGIDNLDGIVSCGDLIHLNINHNFISDLASFVALKGCRKLESLSVIGNPIT